MTQRALITGITGMVGSHLADFLLANTNWEVHGMCRWRSPMDNVEHLLGRSNRGDGVFFHYADLNDYASLIEVVRKVQPDYVFHLAAQSYPRTSFDAPEDTMNTNILGTLRLLDVLHKFKPDAVIHNCASSEIFGRVPKELTPIKEDTPFHPASPYAISKVGTDLIGRYYGEAFNMAIMSTRMFTHTGPRRGDVFAESTFAKQIAMAEAGLIPPVIKTGNLESLRTWADVRDAVRAYHMLVTINPIPGEFYNIGGTHVCTVREMLDFLIANSTIKDSLTVETDPERLRPIDADLQVPDTTKFQSHTGWKPEISFETTMIDLLNFWREKIKSGRNFLSR
jgi:GDP-mannose 4,6-dehydratase